jgi:hypothetical protein
MADSTFDFTGGTLVNPQPFAGGGAPDPSEFQFNGGVPLDLPNEMITDAETGEVREMPSGSVARLVALSEGGFNQATDQNHMSYLYFDILMGNDTPDKRAKLAELQAGFGPEFKPDGIWEEMALATSRQIPTLMGMAHTAWLRATQGAVAGGIAGSAIAGIGAIPGMFGGAAGGALTGPVENTFILTAGQSYGQLEKLKDTNGKLIDPRAAQVGAIIAGAGAAGLELVPISLIMKLVPGLKKVLGNQVDSVLSRFKIPKGKTAFQKFVVNLSTLFAAETLTEGAQELVISSGEDIAALIDKDDFVTTPVEQRLNDTAEAMRQSMLALAPLSPVMATPRFVGDVVEQRSEKKKAADTKQQRATEQPREQIDSIAGKVKAAQISQDLKTFDVYDLSPEEFSVLEDIGVDVSPEGRMSAASAELLVAESFRRSEFFQEQQAKAQKKARKEEDATLKKIRRGRIKAIDKEIGDMDALADQLLDSINTNEKAGKPFKRLSNRLATLLKKREKLDEERGGLLTPEGEAQTRNEARLAAEENITLKGTELLKEQARQRKAQTRALEQGFRKGVTIAKRNVKAAQEVVIAALDASNLSTENKAKFIKTIKNIQTAEQLTRAIPTIMNRINKLETKQRRKDATKRLKSVLGKQTQVKNFKGKVGVEVQRIMDVARKAYHMKLEAAQARLAEMANSNAENVPSALAALENNILMARLDEGLKDADKRLDIDQLENLVTALESGVTLGKAIHGKNWAAKAAKVAALRERLYKLVGQRPNESQRSRRRRQIKQNFQVRTIIGFSAAWATKLRFIMQSSDGAAVDTMIDDLSLFHESRAHDRGRRQSVLRFTELAMAAIGTASQRTLQRYLQKSETEYLNLLPMRHADGVTRAIDVETRAQARKRVMEFRDPKLRESMMHESKGNMYTEEIIEAITQSLTEEDHRLVDAQIQFYAEYYTRIAEVYERVYGIPLPQLESYSPIRRVMEDGTAADEFLQSIQYRGSVAPGSLRSRAPSIREVRVQSDFQVLHSHIAEMEYFIAFAEKVQQLEAVFGDPELQKQIKNTSTELMWKELKKDLDYFAKRGRDVAIINESILTTLMRNFSFAQLGAKPQIGLKQMASFAAYAQNVSSVDFTAGLLAFAANPRKALRVLNKSELFRDRGYNIDQDYQAILSDKSFFNFIGQRPTLAKILMLPIKYGDKTAIAIGGYAFVHARMKAGVSEAQALVEFGRMTVATQQSTDIDQMSSLQRTSSLMRVATQFMSSANALTRAEYNAILDRRAGRITRKQFAKRILILHIVIPTLIQFIANGFTWDDEDQGRAALLGTMNGLFIIGDVADGLARMLTGGSDAIVDIEGRHPAEFTQDIFEALLEVQENGFDFEDIMEESKALDLFLKGGAAATGLPLHTIMDEIRGLAKLTEANDFEDLREALMMSGGYSGFAIDNALDN